MVNTSSSAIPPRTLRGVVALYVLNVGVALLALIVLAAADPREATGDAWVHSVIVLVLAGVLVARLRSAEAGRRSGLRAVGIICSLLLVANLVLALTPGLLPDWLRLDAIVVAALMVAAVSLVIRTALDDA